MKRLMVFVALIMIISFQVFGAPTLTTVTYGQSEQFEWKTYLNPKHGFTLEYPDRFDTFLFRNPDGDRVGVNSNTYADYYWSMGLSIEPFNVTKFKDLKGVADYYYNLFIVESGDKSLYPVNRTEFTKFPSYTYTIYNDDENPGDYRISKAVFQIHDGHLYNFYLSDLNIDIHFDEFDRFVNSLKFFN